MCWSTWLRGSAGAEDELGQPHLHPNCAAYRSSALPHTPSWPLRCSASPPPPGGVQRSHTAAHGIDAPLPYYPALTPRVLPSNISPSQSSTLLVHRRSEVSCNDAQHIVHTLMFPKPFPPRTLTWPVHRGAVLSPPGGAQRGHHLSHGPGRPDLHLQVEVGETKVLVTCVVMRIEE